MRKILKKISKATYLHHIAAHIQEIRRELLRSLHTYDSVFSPGKNISFRIDNASRKPFLMFTRRDKNMMKEMKAFLRIAHGKKCFLDIGSHYGIYSLTFCSLNPDGVAYAIEPSEKCGKVLLKNRALNPDLTIKYYAKAFSAKKGILAMHYEWVHLIVNTKNTVTSTSVETTSLDEFVTQEKIDPDLIKIDVDGYEGPVLEGADRFLQKNDPVILMELHGEWVERYGYKTDQLAAKMSAWGYRFYDLSLQPVKNVSGAFSEFANRIICLKSPLAG